MPTAGTTEHLRKQRGSPAIEPILMRVPDACRYLGIGRSTLYVLIGKREIEIIKRMKRVLKLPVTHIARAVNRNKTTIYLVLRRSWRPCQRGRPSEEGGGGS